MQDKLANNNYSQNTNNNPIKEKVLKKGTEGSSDYKSDQNTGNSSNEDVFRKSKSKSRRVKKKRSKSRKRNDSTKKSMKKK
jgi:hypothetical protein